jgi:hypothetical protein
MSVTINMGQVNELATKMESKLGGISEGTSARRSSVGIRRTFRTSHIERWLRNCYPFVCCTDRKCLCFSRQSSRRVSRQIKKEEEDQKKQQEEGERQMHIQETLVGNKAAYKVGVAVLILLFVVT